ncbi:hypothetical protein LshimejAT787_0211830 [Lyophyllum shimeji]|uniref:Uncharacterized protein n=1 Tax=Lyophyllum shimeji TaxID=47721 RepID=A0A9P3UJE6_LYOSH|nr:hypothetical protein LshimejAT787_0211830 [Lyophyllum shimeji]
MYKEGLAIAGGFACRWIGIMRISGRRENERLTCTSFGRRKFCSAFILHAVILINFETSKMFKKERTAKNIEAGIHIQAAMLEIPGIFESVELDIEEDEGCSSNFIG